MFIQVPGGPHTLIAAVLTRYENRLKRDLATFFEVLATVTAPGGSSALFGDDAPADNLELEPAQRAWINEHIASNLLKVVVDLEPNTAPVQIVIGGEARTLLLVESPDGFRSNEALVTALTERLIVPLERGKDFVVAEIAPDAIRFHDGRLRTDGRLVLKDRRRAVEDAPDDELPVRTASILRPIRALLGASPLSEVTPPRPEAPPPLPDFDPQTVTRSNAAYTSD